MNDCGSGATPAFDQSRFSSGNLLRVMDQVG
jgi:hypothetical protein